MDINILNKLIGKTVIVKTFDYETYTGVLSRQDNDSNYLLTCLNKTLILSKDMIKSIAQI